ncbi:MAG TPA: type II 3-dehydroquinate dehydratase [Arenimonas sp.]|nr:type II 3-dehydroquinate dehydratase [Arenimonas sp.]HOZ04158.1 type II 3-dehydroquinate dehydratase [Arenimonas sp.]HPW31918.1 type II 3-dehydroquinate dehydratase [Arenimonas sp.]
MSIAIIRGAETSRLTEIGSHEIPKEVFSLLTGRASTAGKQIELRTFKSEEDLIDCLRRANEACFEFVMLDPGTCECSSQQLRNIMNRLTMPYIEVHDDHFGALEHTLTPDYAPRLTMVQGYGPQSYVLALSIALEHLGCAECGYEFHVGT